MSESRPERVVTLQLPRKLAFLLEMHAYKVAWGGRGSLKSWNFARALLTLGIHQDLRILCLREVQKSLADSVHLLLTDQIKRLGYESLYSVTENAIRGPARIQADGSTRETLFRFAGLSDQTSDSLKSYENFDIFWFEEAQNITRRSFQIALPTLFRTPKAEAWISFNPGLDTDEVWERFIVHPPEGARVVEMNWRDALACGWMTAENERLRQYDYKHSPDDYENIWEGKPRTTVAGAIYSREITDMVKEGRFRPMPYDPKLPVHRIWDLGWNDLMTVVMVQKPHPSAVTVVNYIEESQATYAEMIQTMAQFRYKIGTDWLPHDSVQHHPTSGTNAVKQLRDLGCKVKVIQRSDTEQRIRAARMMFPRVYMDTTKRETPTDRPDQLLGAGHLMDRLKRYRRNVPKSTNEPTTPMHDAACVGPDTKIRTLSGWKRIADLVGKEFHVWGYCEAERRIVPARALRCWQAKVAETVAKVTLDDGAMIYCTTDHRFLRRDGIWTEAADLTPRQSLMPLHELHQRHGHTRIHLTDGTIADEHRYAYSRLVGYLRDGMHIHHKDEDKANNEPSNLVQLTPAEHCSIHSSTPEHIEHLRRIGFRSGNPKSTAMLVQVNRLRSGDAHHTRNPDYWTQERREKTAAAFSLNYTKTETLKVCACCDGTFVGNWKRMYCCSYCKDRAMHRKGAVAAPRPWRVKSEHAHDCRLSAPNNHRVIAVEIIRQSMPVFDIEVEGIHNFAAEGVILHNSHGADAFGGLAEIVDQIRNEGDVPEVKLPEFRNVEPSMGLLS